MHSFDTNISLAIEITFIKGSLSGGHRFRESIVHLDSYIVTVFSTWGGSYELMQSARASYVLVTNTCCKKEKKRKRKKKTRLTLTYGSPRQENSYGI